MKPKESLLSSQMARLDQYHYELRLAEQGTVISVGDGIAWIRGLPSAQMDEILNFEEGSQALVFHLEQEILGAILLRQTNQMTAGTIAHLSGQRLSVPVGDELLGRVIDPLGVPLDGLSKPGCSNRRNLEMPSPPILARDFVKKPLYTGIKVVDSMIPIGKGQRQLIVGDNGLGKTSFALDSIINQKGKGTHCVYVVIGQKRSGVVEIIETLRRTRALEYTSVVVAEATALPGLKYLGPFAGCAVAEAWMWQGKDCLVVYDDLTSHARTYRELSLLLRRPPGREAYPGDIFYLHSRLLERSTCLLPSYGGGSMTAFPIVETEQGEIATYIPTNLISITDGQIYFERGLFSRGILPSIDVTHSVSRIGGNAQHPKVRNEAGRIKLDYLQFLELEVFTRFGSRIEASMEAKINRGRVIREILKQNRFSSHSIEFQMAWMVAFNEGLLDGLKLENVSDQLKRLEENLKGNTITLSDTREQWVQALQRWLEDREKK
ncbi:MAG TPA: F0F1 ATP synthase subunit alpha [Nitrospiria bacterium]|jgi:F-type H+-transporting ATPase subunit alpha